MRNFFSLVFFIILSVSCNNNQDKNYKKTIKTEHKKKIKESDLDYFQLKLSKKEVEKISLNVKSDLGYKDIVLKGIEQLCGQTTYESIDSLYINYLEQINIIDYGKTLVFETQIFGNLPFSSPTHYYVFYNTKRAEICIFPFSRLYLFKTRNEHKQSFFGGVEIRKNVGFFDVFFF
jgi:hypothetical protein